MRFNVPEEEKPKFNKRVQEEFISLTDQFEDISFQAAASEEPAIEFNSVRDADGNIISNKSDLLSTPLTGDKIKALGLVDAEGNATDKGELFYNLKEAGMFDDAGVITKKGQAYLVKPEDINEPENIDAFIQQWDDGLTRGETTWGEKGEALLNLGGEVLAGVGQSLWVTGKNAYYQFDNRKGFDIPFMRSEATDNRPPELIAETVATNLAVGEKLITNLSELGRMVDVGLNWAGDKIKDPAWWGQSNTPTKEDSRALYEARQRQAKTRQAISNMEAGEVAEVVYGLKGAVDVAEQAKATIGKDAFDQTYKNIGSATEIFGGVENLIPGTFAFKLAKSAPLLNRANLVAQRTIGKVLTKELEIGALETSLEAAKLAVQRGDVSAKLTSKFIEEGAAAGASPVAIGRAAQATEIAAKTTKITDDAVAAIPELTSKLDELTKARNSLSTTIPEAAANAAIKTLEVGRQVRGLPAKTIGTVIEGVGNTLTKVDGAISNFLKEKGLDQMYTAALGAGGVIGIAGNPLIGAIATGAAALKAGKMLTNYGKLFKYVGKEMTQVRGQIPFWKRVAAHTEAGSLNRGIAHTFNMLDLGGVTSDTLRRIPRGVAAAAPSDLMFEWLSDGADMRPETFYQAAAESLYIGGSFAAAGGAFMGTKTRMRQLAIGDQLNFNQGLTDTRQKALYNQLDAGTRNSIATYSIANPTLNYVFKDNGASNYDPNTNTATINVNSNNSIKPLIAHETLHHTVIKNNMEAGISALFLGDTVGNTVGGLLRSRDGKLDPNFESFKDAYYQRLGLAGMTDAEKTAIYPLDKIAVEYFIEQHSDQYAGMAESGELGAIAASGDIKRKLSGVLETVLPRIPVLRDLHFKSGGMIDKDGGWVTGNGILDAGGVKTNPITNKMFRDMNRRSSGLAPGQFEPLVSDKQDSGAQLSLDPSNPIDSELLHPLIKVDENGSPVLENGKPVALDKVTLLQRALAGLTAKEVMQRKKAENYIPEKGEAHVDDIGEFQPGWLSNDVLAEMFSKNSFNPEQKRIIREMNRMIRKGDGGRAVMINFPATTRNKAGKVVYKAQGATLRDTVPVAITISKDGNLLFGLMSVTKLQENIQKRSRSRLGKKLYSGNVDLILRDTQAMMQFHKDGVDSIEYFKDKYGAVEANERKLFINTMFGLLNQKEQAVLNPMLVEDGVKSRDNVYRTYRADRVSKAVAMSPDDYPAMPFSYEAASQVKMPEQSRQMPEVAVVPERFTGSATDADRRGKYVEPPSFFKKFNIDSYERGGRFFDAESGEDLTGKQYSTGSIDVSTGKPRLFVDNVSDATPSGNKFKTNLFKQRAGWKWTSKNPPPTSTIVSVEGQGKHVYTLKANFEGGVELARYSEKASEPRLRPTAYGELKLGDKVGEISIRGKAHPVYDSVGIIPKVKEQLRQMPEVLDVSPEDVNPVANRQEAIGLFADGKTMFAFDEMDGTPTRITSLEMLNSYTPDTIGWMEPEADSGARYMPEKIDADYMKAVESGDVEMQQSPDPVIVTKDYATGDRLVLISGGVQLGRMLARESKGRYYEIFENADGYNKKKPISKARFDEIANGGSTNPRYQTAEDIASLAARAGYTVEAFHSTNAKSFNVFDADKAQGMDLGYHFGSEQAAKDRSEGLDAALDSNERVRTRDMGDSRVIPVFLKLNNPLRLNENRLGTWQMSDILKQIFESENTLPEFKGDTEAFFNDELSIRMERSYGDVEDVPSWDMSSRGEQNKWLETYLKSKGFDGIVYENNFEAKGNDSYIVFNPNQIKSADPITRDDAGNAIPPSKRFDQTTSDIRYMPEKEVDVKTIEKSDTDTEQGTPAPDSDVQSIPLTGNPIPWDRFASRQVRFMPESVRSAFPTMSPKLLAQIEAETSTLAAIHIDRMRVGEYMGIDLQGGMFYPTIKENLENGVVWAFNSTGVARTVANRATQNNGYVKLILMQEGNVIGNKTFTNIWFKILSDSIDKKQISKGLALTELNAARRVVYEKLKGKDPKRNPWVAKHASRWESLDEARESILSMPQIERGGTYFKKSKTQTKSEGEKMSYQALLSQKMTKLGFPDAKKIVNDIEEPAFKGIPNGAAVAIIKFDLLGPDEKIMTAKEAGVPEHMSYGWVLKGKPIAKLGYYQVVDETFPETKSQIMTQQNTDFPIKKSIPSKGSARGEIKYNQATQLAIANAAKLK